MSTTIKIYNVFSREDGEKLIHKLSKITEGNYHNFTYLMYPVGGSLDISITSDYDFDGEDKEKEMLSFFNFMILGNI